MWLAIAGQINGTPSAVNASETGWYVSADERVWGSQDQGASWSVVAD